MDWKSKWGCKCGAIWTSMDESPPADGRCPTCANLLTRLSDQPLLTDEWTRLERSRGG